ncbi:hypothetical protein HD806DRAFT_515508 [Xylariaceae sp. AK1471]|nr:hypothetical protein HD806DRAFT_515508 [Xylariaceae sp. AK1471]
MDASVLITPELNFEMWLWKYFTVAKEVSFAFQATRHTEAAFWDLRYPSSHAGPLNSEGLLSKLSIVEAAMAGGTAPAGVRTQQQHPSNAQPPFFLISSVGCPSAVKDTIHISPDVFKRLNAAIGFRQEFHSFYFTELFHCSYHFAYENSGDDVDIPTSLIMFLRCPRNSKSVVCVLRIRLSDRGCVALLFGCDHHGVQRLANLCAAQSELLKIHPLYLLAFIYETRYEIWTHWLSSIWMRINAIETATNMTSPSWSNEGVPLERIKALKDPDTLLTYIHGTHTELCHCETVVSFATSFGPFCLDMLDILEGGREQQSLPALAKRHRAGLEERIKFTATRCNAVRERIVEFKERLRGQINVVSLPMKVRSEPPCFITQM